MLAILEVGLARELQAILILYLGTILSGFSMGFSAVAVPDIKAEMRYPSKTSQSIPRLITKFYSRSNQSYSDLPSIIASDEELSWFGKFECKKYEIDKVLFSC